MPHAKNICLSLPNYLSVYCNIVHQLKSTNWRTFLSSSIIESGCMHRSSFYQAFCSESQCSRNTKPISHWDIISVQHIQIFKRYSCHKIDIWKQYFDQMTKEQNIHPPIIKTKTKTRYEHWIGWRVKSTKIKICHCKTVPKQLKYCTIVSIYENSNKMYKS